VQLVRGRGRGEIPFLSLVRGPRPAEARRVLPGAALPGEIGKALRVSRYFPDAGEEGHVRFSVWNETGVAESVVSLAEADAARLADFVHESAPAGSEPCGRRTRW
jgi:hypothetical protein